MPVLWAKDLHPEFDANLRKVRKMAPAHALFFGMRSQPVPGKLADGTPSEVLRPDVLEAAYACPVSVIPLPGLAATCVLPRLS